VTPITDRAAMLRALELARGQRGRTWPNPMVGCVIVRDGRIVAEGVTQEAGSDHGEIDALGKIDFRAEGCTLYVSLEPCCHWGRTPPCTDAILRSGASRVVVGTVDPFPAVAGKGIEQLRKAGLQVEVGLLGDACRAVNEAHFVWATEQRPFVTLKGAVTLDGRTATRTGASAWITGERARAHARRERGMHQAVLVGVGTVLADDPRLNLRDQAPGLPEPARVVLDSRLRTPPTARLLSGEGGPVWILTAEDAPVDREQALVDAGAEVIRLPGAPRPALRAALKHLAEERKIAALFVEGGATLHGSLIDEGLADRFLLYVAPKVFGGAGATPLALGTGVADPADARQLAPFAVQRLGDDVLLETRPLDGPGAAWWAARHRRTEA
jgi:diaminohydroxyphosphoribosylaminopyrimidine deaminase/5-amino-6-(5-phosphoribosylamino)uracil reductase